jgi:hypothetical protein
MVDMVPVRELPYGPAAMRRNNRPDRWQHPTIATYPNLPLASSGASADAQ